MSLTLLLYLSEMLHHVREFAGAIIVLCLLVYFGTLFGFIITLDSFNAHKGVSDFIKYLLGKLWILIIAILVNVFIPSQQTMYLMMGTSYLADSKIPSKVSEILNLKLEDVLKQLKKDSKND
jgi:FtsH-binding integral membrane protein